MALRAFQTEPRLPGPGAEVFDMRADFEHCSCDLALDPQSGDAPIYNEQAFHYFLELEQRRSTSPDRTLLLLVDLRSDDDGAWPLESALAARLLTTLCHSLRETDLVGWYRETQMIGAVLSSFGDTPSRDVALDKVRSRVTAVLLMHVPNTMAERLRVRVYQLPAGVKR